MASENSGSFNNEIYFSAGYGAKNEFKSGNSRKKSKSGKGGKGGGYNKKSKNGYTALLLIAIAVIAICYYLYKGGYIFKEEKPERVSGLNDLFCGVTTAQTDELKVHFIDVGQGDCIFIQFPDGKNMLVDCGDKWTKTRWDKSNASKSNAVVIKEYLASVGVKDDITVVLATHADADHISNMTEVFDEYNVSYCLRPSVYYSGEFASEFSSEFNVSSSAKKHDDKDTKTYYNFLKAVQDEGCGWEYFNYESDFSQEFTFNGGTYNYSVEFLTPLETVGNIGYSDRNDYSPIVWIKYGEFDFVMSGDANELVEKQYLNYVKNNGVTNYPQSVELFKVGHHGSETSSCEDFINFLNPDNAVFCCGKGNKHEHPRSLVMNRIVNVGANVWRTDLHGNIVFTASPSGTYKCTTQNPETVETSLLLACPK